MYRTYSWKVHTYLEKSQHNHYSNWDLGTVQRNFALDIQCEVLKFEPYVMVGSDYILGCVHVAMVEFDYGYQHLRRRY
jgi:hypothetical protein